MPSPKKKTFTIRKQAAGLLDVRTDIDLTAPASVVDMLDSRGRLPVGVDTIRLADVELAVSVGDKAITFGSDARKVAFSAEAGPFGGLGAYRSQKTMLSDLATIATGDAKTPAGLDQVPFPEVGAERYFVLYAGYGAQASGNGSVALGPAASATFGASGGRRRAFTVVQAHAAEPRVDEAVRGLVEAWRLPRQVKGVDDVPPGTWIVAEVAGNVRANAGVTFGLDYNWVRSVKAGELQGDIGLKIQAGANAAFGYSLSDRYAVVVGRDSLDPDERKLRVRLHRLNERGWSFAASASLSLTGSTGKLLPKQMDDFLAATLGVHGMQTLAEVRRWTDPNKQLSEVAADFVNDFAKKRFNGTLANKFDEVHTEVTEWFSKWDSLPSQASSALWDIVRLDQKQVNGFVAKIQKLAAGDEKAVQAEVAALLSRADFAETPLGSWLEKVAGGRVMGVLANVPEARAVSEAAAKTLDILNGGLLAHLQDFVENRVGLAPVRRAIEENDFKTLNPKLKAKLVEFLGKTRLDAKAIQDIRETVAALDKRGGELYKAAVKALNETYKFTFDYAYQRSVTKTALLDVAFDFGAPRASEAKLSKLLQAAIGGDFRGVLPPPGARATTGVSFQEAALTHHIQRSSSVKITLPFFTSQTIKQTSSLAGFKLASEDGGLYLYALDAKDDVQRASKWRSTMSVGMSLQVGEDSKVRRHDREDARTSMDYHFTRRLPGLRTAHFERLLDVLGPAYFPHEIGLASPPEKPSAHEWALALDKAADGADAERDDGLIGDSLLQLEVSLPGAAVTRWLQAPLNKKDAVYAKVSRRVQELLRRYIPFIYFQDVKKYKDLGSAHALLVYSALQVSTSSQKPRVVTAKLEAELAEAAKVLASADTKDLRKKAQFYAPSEVRKVAGSVREGPGKTLLASLRANEASVIKGAVKAGLALAKFREKSADPEKAVEALAEFGERITRTFNDKLQSIFKPKSQADREVLRNLGLLVFAQVSEAFPPGTPVAPSARLELTVFNSGMMPALGKKIPAEAVSLRQALVEPGADA